MTEIVCGMRVCWVSLFEGFWTHKCRLSKEKNPSELNSFTQAPTQWSHSRNVGEIKVRCVVLNFHLTLRWDPSVFTSGARITANLSVRARDLKTGARIPLRPFYSSFNSSFKALWLIWPQISSNRVEQKDPVLETYKLASRETTRLNSLRKRTYWIKKKIYEYFSFSV